MTAVCHCGYPLPRIRVLLVHTGPAAVDVALTMAYRVFVECPQCGRSYSRDVPDGATVDEPRAARVNATGGRA